jgi:hypothetical protein
MRFSYVIKTHFFEEELALFLSKRHATKTYGGIGVLLHEFLASTLGADGTHHATAAVPTRKATPVAV